MAKKPGIGYADAHRPCSSIWLHQSGRRAVETFIRTEYRPFGPDGGGPITQGSPGASMMEIANRYFGGRLFGSHETLSPQGIWGDMWQVNGVCGQRWFADQPASHRSQYDGVVTLEDVYDIAASNPRRNSHFYARYWFSRLAGGRLSTAIVVDERSWYSHQWVVEQEGWKVGLHSILNDLGYPIYYDVRWMPDGAPSKPPTDPPVDPPPPPPPPDPEPEPPGKRLSPPEVRAEELWEMVEEVFRRARPVPGWLIRLRQETKPFAIPLLPDAVRIKRRLAGQPEEGSEVPK